MKRMIGFLITSLLLVQPYATGQSLHYDSSGHHGSNGSSGGYSGGNAGPSSRGTNAGDINLTLRDLDQSGRAVMQVVGTVDRRQVSDGVDLSGGVSVSIVARGGDGGDGGRGGDGSTGSPGSSGSNATRYSSGTNGGDGGRGGDGGDGTPGSNGGDGGKIVVTLPAEDTHLALLVRADTAGGAGGAAGRNGEGGRGGSGGSGGSSYSWSEKVGERCSPDSTSSNGNGSYTVVKGSCTDIMQSGSNSGGMSGSDGPRGSDGNGNISPGSKGSDGNFTFQVRSADGSVAHYRQAFNLQLQSFQFRELTPNGIFEPGEVVEVTDLRVQNHSDMPWTPGKARSIITLRTGGWIIAEPIEIDVPAVGAGQTVVLPKIFRFKIRDNTLPASENRLSISESIVPTARITRLEKTMSGLQLPKTLVISYPVEISRLQAKRSAVKPGESVEVFWSVKNLSQNPLGLQSAEARAVATALKAWRPAADAGLPGGVTFNGADAAATAASGFSQSVALLAPGASFIVKGTLSFDQNHLPYTDVNISTNLSLKTLESKNEVREIQMRTFRFSIAQTFSGAKDAQWLIITNGGTKREEYLAWLKLASQLKKKIDVWDLSYQGYLAWMKTLAAGSSLSDIYAGKTVIVLNNTFLHDNADTNSRAMFSQPDTIKALAEKGTRFYFVGGARDDAQWLIDSLLTPSATESAGIRSFEFDAALDYFKKKSPVDLNASYFIDVQEKFLRTPDQNTFLKRVNKIRATLADSYPNTRFMISLQTNAVEKLNDDFYALYRLGRLTVTPSLDRRAEGHLVWLPRDESEMKTSEFVLGAENVQALLLASNIQDRYMMLKSMATSGWKDVLINGLVLELAETLDIPAANTKPVEKLTALVSAETDVAFKTDVLSLLDARLEYYSDHASKFKMGSKVKALRKALASGANSKAFAKQADAETDRLDKVADSRRDVLVGIDKKANVRRMLFLPLISRSVRSNHSLTHGLL